jgi:hypothetical protein
LLHCASLKSLGYIPLSYETLCPMHIPSMVPLSVFRQILR